MKVLENAPPLCPSDYLYPTYYPGGVLIASQAVSNAVPKPHLTASLLRPLLEPTESVQVVWQADAETKLGVQEIYWVVMPMKDQGEGSRNG